MPAELPNIRLSEPRVVEGYRHDFQQPCLRLQLELRPLDVGLSDVSGRLERALDHRLVPMPDGMQPAPVQAPTADQPAPTPVWPVVVALNELLVRVQETAGVPVAGGLRCEVIAPVRADSGQWLAVLAVPCLSPVLLRSILPWAVEQVGAVAYDGQATLRGLDAALRRLERHAPSGINNRWLLHAAYRYGVPVTSLPGKVFQYGWGACSRWMDSTFTDRTSTLSARLSRNKVTAHALLRRAGLPVPLQVVVRSPDEAVAQAERMGYPVVIKPSDLDGGRGVSAGIEDEATLRRSYARAAAQSKNLILEKHIPGHDYRLGIVHGQLAWATFREPAGVRGDGASTVEQLVAITNQDPKRGTQKWSNMRPLVIDAEVEEVLQAQGLQRDSTPAHGQFVRFRRTSNISAGGTPTSMMGQVHPDNIALALRAANVLRLDLAGIDLITPDVTRSWLEVGGALCEINGQPQFSVLGPQAPLIAIRGLFEGDGRIPVLVVLTARPGHALVQAVASAARRHGLVLGASTERGLSIGGAVVRSGRRSAFDDALALLLDTQVQAVAVVTDGAEWSRRGSPFDAVDLLLVADDASVQAQRDLRSRCAGEVWTLRDEQALDAAAIGQSVADWLSASSARHRAVDLSRR